jgi:hypothetical protein
MAEPLAVALEPMKPYAPASGDLGRHRRIGIRLPAEQRAIEVLQRCRVPANDFEVYDRIPHDRSLVTGALVVKRDGALPTASAGFNAALDGILSDAATLHLPASARLPFAELGAVLAACVGGQQRTRVEPVDRPGLRKNWRERPREVGRVRAAKMPERLFVGRRLEKPTGWMTRIAPP